MKKLKSLSISLLVVLFACSKADENIQLMNPVEFELLWETAIPFLPQGIVLDRQGENYIYVAAKSGGLIVLDNNSSPAVQIADIPIAEFGNLHAMSVFQQDNYLFLALGDFFGSESKAGLAIVDVADPSSPKTSDVWETANVVKGSAMVITNGNHAFLGAMNEGVYVFDVSDKRNILETDHFIPDPDFPIPNPNSVQEPNARGLAIRGNDLFVAYDAGGIRVVDVTDKSSLYQKSQYINELFDKQKAYNNIILNGTYAYTATDYCGMEVLDISDLNNITMTSWCNPWACETNANTWFNSAGHTNQLVLDANNDHVILSSGGSEITMLDVSDPNNCLLIKSFGQRENDLGTWGVDVVDNKIYATYITTLGIPFRGTWSGVKCIEYN